MASRLHNDCCGCIEHGHGTSSNFDHGHAHGHVHSHGHGDFGTGRVLSPRRVHGETRSLVLADFDQPKWESETPDNSPTRLATQALLSDCTGNAVGHENGGTELRLESPQSFSQSVQWLRAHDPAECSYHVSNMGFAQRCEQARCDHSELNSTANVIVLIRANELTSMSRANTAFAFLSVLYMAVNGICIVLNAYGYECDPTHDHSCDSATTPSVFHLLEFWATTMFNILDLLALSFSPKTLSNQYEHPNLLKLLVLFNIGLSFSSSMLVTINLEKFEVLSHELEYLNELTITIFDITILLALIRGRTHEINQVNDTKRTSLLTLVAVACLATTQLGIYNLSGWTADGDSKGETAAHYLEFAFGIVSAGITFWFTMDNRMSADKRLRALMYGGKTAMVNCASP